MRTATQMAPAAPLVLDHHLRVALLGGELRRRRPGYTSRRLPTSCTSIRRRGPAGHVSWALAGSVARVRRETLASDEQVSACRPRCELRVAGGGVGREERRPWGPLRPRGPPRAAPGPRHSGRSATP